MVWFITQRPWAIHNPLKSWTLAGLSLRECQLLVASMTDAEMKVSWVHHEKWSDWKPLGDPECHELILYKDKDHVELPALPQITQEADHEITQVRSVLGGPQGIGNIVRKHPRYLARCSAEIMVSTFTFNTHTVDMSAGGFCFEDKLPDWVAGYFTVLISTPDRKFEFTCILAEDQKKEKFRAEVAATTSEKVVEDFKEWLSQQNFPPNDHK